MLTAMLSGATLGLVNLVHCASMCGPLSSAVCLRAGRQGLARYQVGRALSYVFIGALSGHLGRALSLLTPSHVSIWVVATLTAAACLLTARALLRAGSDPSALVQLRASSEPRRTRRSLFAVLLPLVPRDPFVFGLLSALLPCGVLASAVLAAVASGSAPNGSLLMAGFAAVSGSAVLAAGLVTQHVPRRYAPAFRRVVAAALVAAAALAVARPIQATARSASDTAPHAVHCH